MEKAEFRNTSRGHCGVIVIEAGQKPRGISVRPGDTVWLTEEEQIETANKPRKPEDNPFVNGTLTLVTEPKDLVNRRPIGHTAGAQAEPTDEERAAAEAKRVEDEEAQAKMKADEEAREEAAKNTAAESASKAANVLPHQRSGEEPVPIPEEKGVEVEPVGDAPEGERAAKEEVGTPAAESAAKPKPAPVKAKA